MQEVQAGIQPVSFRPIAITLLDKASFNSPGSEDRVTFPIDNDSNIQI